MRRHNFNAGFVEGVLDVLEQVRHYRTETVGVFDICVDLIAGIIVRQVGLENEGLRMLEHARCYTRGVNQELVDETPRCVIAYSDCGVYDEAELAC